MWYLLSMRKNNTHSPGVSYRKSVSGSFRLLKSLHRKWKSIFGLVGYFLVSVGLSIVFTTNTSWVIRNSRNNWSEQVPREYFSHRYHIYHLIWNVEEFPLHFIILVSLTKVAQLVVFTIHWGNWGNLWFSIATWRGSPEPVQPSNMVGTTSRDIVSTDTVRQRVTVLFTKMWWMDGNDDMMIVCLSFWHQKVCFGNDKLLIKQKLRGKSCW